LLTTTTKDTEERTARSTISSILYSPLSVCALLLRSLCPDYCWPCRSAGRWFSSPLRTASSVFPACISTWPWSTHALAKGIITVLKSRSNRNQPWRPQQQNRYPQQRQYRQYQLHLFPHLPPQQRQARPPQRRNQQQQQQQRTPEIHSLAPYPSLQHHQQ